ncbi:hypothetical protein, conserved [Leishmania donovani]|uniref:B30.2/SPRY domain-containing protein n=1 Tax=Leishmania donovani TaxID=5661 RepID=E9BHD8_LEIDO|nr:hypothetical protein, conserved [Leishmania donovani]AYU79364.1 hypothetical protein LdCL_250008500 [Leishmania donovani]CBZ34664.1 hypothetical protein, conserved [Leishmania donovani]
MISDEGFLSALSLGGGEQRPSPFPSAIPLSGTPSPVRDASALLSYTEAMTPNLYSALSASATYPSAYLSDPYISSAASASHAVPPPLSSNPYTYGSWTAPAPPLRSAVAAGPSAEAEARAALSEAERQRQILQLERELAEEQRQRLEARLSPLSSSAARLSVSVPCGRTPSSEAAGDASRYGGSEASSSPPPECAHDEVGEELRAFSMEAPAPPSSPSPPSAHVQARLYVRGANGGVDACGPPAAASKRPQEQPAEPSAPPSPFLATPAAAANGLAKGSAVSPQPHPSKTPSPQRSSPQPCTPPKEAAPSLSTSEQCASAPITRAGASSPSPQRALVRSEERRTSQRPAPSPPPSEGDGSRASPRKPNSAQRAVTDMHEDEEQRLYEAYKQKLARIQEALRPPSGTGVLCATASFEACRAHQRRYRLTTPALWSSTPPALPSSSPPLRATGELPLVRRAPSTGSYADPVAPLSCGRQRQLRWDIAHSGNIVVSSDGYVCKADATDALALIEREYEGRLEDVLQRLVIPFYAMGNLGLTRGSLTFAFRWESPTTMHRASGRQRRGRGGGGGRVRRAPALAFGFATRAFTGYGTEAPAFLYLSTGAIAQGVSTTTSAGAERPYGAPYAPGSELAARLDLEHGELEFYVEGVSMGVAFRFCPARHPAPLFPVAVFSAEMDLAELLYSA